MLSGDDVHIYMIENRKASASSIGKHIASFMVIRILTKPKQTVKIRLFRETTTQVVFFPEL